MFDNQLILRSQFVLLICLFSDNVLKAAFAMVLFKKEDAY